MSHGVISPQGEETNSDVLLPEGILNFMYDTILIWVSVLLSFALTFVGLNLAIRPAKQEHEHRKRVEIFLCFVCSVVALIAAMYIGSKKG